ncbi:MAG: hypothetical protein ABII75_03310 [Candidatus Omnitrophota bacterium]
MKPAFGEAGATGSSRVLLGGNTAEKQDVLIQAGPGRVAVGAEHLA